MRRSAERDSKYLDGTEVQQSCSGEEDAAVSDTESEQTVDVVLSDMSAPWVQTKGFFKRSLSNPYHRMMNTSGVSFRDHAGSMVCSLTRSGRSRIDPLTIFRIFAGLLCFSVLTS
jgi:hypothetical protein